MPASHLEISANDIVFAFTAIVIGIALLVTFFFIIVISYYKANARRQTELVRTMMETQEKERNRIAIDMHDELGPLLSAVKLQVGALKKSVSEKGIGLIHETEALADSAIIQIRQIIRDLVPRNIDLRGLCGVIGDLKLYFENFTPIVIHLQLPPSLQRFNLQDEINIYRIVQEIMNNAVKHSNAKNIFISIEETNDLLSLTVKDDGHGFDRNKIYDGSGLKNIETRILLNRGRLELQSAALSGTSYFITFEKKYIS